MTVSCLKFLLSFVPFLHLSEFNLIFSASLWHNTVVCIVSVNSQYVAVIVMLMNCAYGACYSSCYHITRKKLMKKFPVKFI